MTGNLAHPPPLFERKIVLGVNSDTPHDLTQGLRPDVLVKGGNWPVDCIVGAKELASRGGQVHSIPFVFQRSTTALIDKIRS